MNDVLIDIFAVGGGGSGGLSMDGSSNSSLAAGGGGASGYNKTDETNGLKYAIENKGGGGGGTNNIMASNYPKIDLGSSGIVVIRNNRK